MDEPSAGRLRRWRKHPEKGFHESLEPFPESPAFHNRPDGEGRNSDCLRRCRRERSYRRTGCGAVQIQTVRNRQENIGDARGGYGLEEIAKATGYKTASAVYKHIEKITREYEYFSNPSPDGDGLHI